MLAADEDGSVVGTADLIPLAGGTGRRAFGPELPPRVLIRNVWVTP